MSNKVKFVNYQEPLSIKIGRFLLERGYDHASSIGVANPLTKTNALGILRKDPDVKPRKSLFGLITHKPRRTFLGVLWLDDKVRGANDQVWVFEAYGRQYIELLKELSEDMTATFGVNIELRLVREQPEIERYYSDFSD